jgi:hypothetical protein
MYFHRKNLTRIVIKGLLAGLIILVGALWISMPAYASYSMIISDQSQLGTIATIANHPNPTAKISETEVREFLQQSENAANHRDIEKMLAAFMPEAMVSFTSEDGERISLNLEEYRRVLEEVFLGYDYYRNMIVVDLVKMQGDRANVGGTTYEKINFGDQPINGVSKWQATVVRQGNDLRFTEVNSYIARAIPR